MYNLSTIFTLLAGFTGRWKPTSSAGKHRVLSQHNIANHGLLWGEKDITGMMTLKHWETEKY